MISSLPLATQAMAGHIGLAGNAQYQLVGIAIVISALAGLAVLVTILGRILAPRQPAAATGTAPAATAEPTGIPPEIRAAIAAAVHTSLQSPHRILEVSHPPDPRLSAWSVEGRRQIFHSHTVR
jgi:Na+-transporting methylmalonyl-CoA/oxaloacetate decarboxylase gamma subunit